MNWTTSSVIELLIRPTLLPGPSLPLWNRMLKPGCGFLPHLGSSSKYSVHKIRHTGRRSIWSEFSAPAWMTCCLYHHRNTPDNVTLFSGLSVWLCGKSDMSFPSNQNLFIDRPGGLWSLEASVVSRSKPCYHLLRCDQSNIIRKCHDKGEISWEWNALLMKVCFNVVCW